MTTYRTVTEWGSKARKAEANAYRGNNHRAAIEEQLEAYEAISDEDVAEALREEFEAGPVTFESAGSIEPSTSKLADTRCGYCGERLGTTDPDLLADEFVYDFDGTLDYISLFHKACKDAADAERDAGKGAC